MSTQDITGIWQLEFCDTEFKDSGKRVALLGPDPIGYLMLTPSGRMMAVLSAKEMETPTNDTGRAKAFRNTVAYTGQYRVENNRWITDVEVSWHPAWKDTTQIRKFDIQGNRLFVATEWAPSITFSGQIVRSRLGFKKHDHL